MLAPGSLTDTFQCDNCQLVFSDYRGLSQVVRDAGHVAVVTWNQYEYGGGRCFAI